MDSRRRTDGVGRGDAGTASLMGASAIDTIPECFRNELRG
jgi:hypothetical protein